MRIRTVLRAVVAASLVAACSGSGGARTTGTTGPGDTGTAGSTTAPGGGTRLPSIDPDDAMRYLVGSAPAPDPALVALAVRAHDELAAKLALPADFLGAFGAGRARPRAGTVDPALALVLLDILVVGQYTPSKDSADLSASIAKEVAGSGGLDAPDGPTHDEGNQSGPFNDSANGASIGGTLQVVTDATAEHSLVTTSVSKSVTATTTAADGTPGSLSGSVQSKVSIDFCPDTAGTVPITLDSTYTASSGGVTVRFHITGQLEGHVDDNANLTSFTGGGHVDGVALTNGNPTPYDANLVGVSIPVGGNGDVAIGSATGQYVGNSQNDAQTLGRKAEAAVIDFETALHGLARTLQGIWQSSGCVTVQVPDFDTYAKPFFDGSVDATKTLAPGGTVDFTVKVHHRFRHTDVAVPVTQVLASNKALTPARIPNAPGTAHYEAPDEVHAENIGTLTTTSRQGKSKLQIRFQTEENPPTIAVTGTITTTAAIATVVGTLNVAPTAFTEIGGDGPPTYQADLQVSTTLTMNMAGIVLPCAALGTEKGALHVEAHSEPRGDSRVWVFHPDPSRSHFDTTTTCVISVAQALSGGGGFSAKFFSALGDFEIPVQPGATPFSRSKALPGGSNDAVNVTVTLVAPPAG